MKLSKVSIAIITIIFLSPLIVGEGYYDKEQLFLVAENPSSGAYLDKVVYQVISGGESFETFSLKSGEVDVLYNTFDIALEDSLVADPDIDIFNKYRSGYGHITINTRDYPLNVSGLRRAFAYAFDKEQVCSEVRDGKAVVHDSLVPLPYTCCIEEELPWHYYEPDPVTGNQILNDLGFTVQPDGWRTAPNGSSIDIEVIHSATSPDLNAAIAQLCVDALESLHIHAHTLAQDISIWIHTLDWHGAYDMISYAAEYPSEDVKWLAYDYWSQFVDEPLQNPSNFQNTTFDGWRDQLLYGTSYEEVYEAASEMQKILHDNVPRLVVYQSRYPQAARTDEFTGFVEDLKYGVGGPWSNLKVHSKTGGMYGGTLTIGVSEQPGEYNLFKITEPMDRLIADCTYSSLYTYGPDLKQYPDLAEDILYETHDTNSSVPSGHTWITVDMRSDADWSDGTPLTAEDVAHTFHYIEASGAYGNPLASEFAEFEEAVALSPYQVQIRLSSDIWYDIEKYLHAKIIPKHVFEDGSGIGYDGWNTWSPVLGDGPYVTSGPFFVSDHGVDTVELTRNINYYWADDIDPLILSSSNVTYVHGSTGNQLYWEVQDDNPLSFSILQDGTLSNSSAWDGSDIYYNIDNLDVGLYEFRLTLTDYSANEVSDTVFVTVTEVYSIQLVTVATVLVIVIIGALVIKKR